jgi:integrase/recombinase XerD
LNPEAVKLLQQLADYLSAKFYSPRTVRNYMAEMRYLFGFYNDVSPSSLVQADIVNYINYIKREHQVGRDKCRMTAQACSFFYKNILPTPYVVPNALYPRKEFRLPDILSEEQIAHLYGSITNPKHKAIIGMFYGTGLRLSELRFLKMTEIDSKNFQIKVIAGKGNKDRFTIFPKAILEDLRAHYKRDRPKVYLFEGQKPGVPMNDRSIQHAIRQCMKNAGLEQFGFSAHSLRHSFATHLLDQGNDIHTIKVLLGHSKIETTMIYLHLQKKKRATLISPLDALLDQQCQP